MAKTFRIAIVGGGVGGLTLAVALRQRGIEADVYEQAQELAEIGAAVALSANSTRELRRLGMGDALATVSTEPGELIYRNWRDGSRIAAHPVHENMNYQKICGAPYYGIHRADLQRILSGALGGAGLHLDHRLTEIRDLGGAAGLSFANGRTIEADLVVGADGVRSVVRRFITGGDDTVYSGTSAFRGIVPVAKLPALPDPGAIQFWMGPDAHLLHYAIGGNADYVNFFAVVEYPKVWPHADKWLDSIQPGEAAAAFAGWHPAVVEMVAQHLPVRWGLFGTRPLLNWHRGARRDPRRRRARYAAASRARRQHHHRGRDHPGGTLAWDRAGRARSDAGEIPVTATSADPQNPTQLLDYEFIATSAGWSATRGTRSTGGAVPGGFRLDPPVRRAPNRS